MGIRAIEIGQSLGNGKISVCWECCPRRSRTFLGIRPEPRRDANRSCAAESGQEFASTDRHCRSLLEFHHLRARRIQIILLSASDKSTKVIGKLFGAALNGVGHVPSLIIRNSGTAL